MNPRALHAAECLSATPRAFAADAVERQIERAPASLSAFGENPFSLVLDDTEQRLRHLAESVALERDEIFAQHVGWEMETHAGRDLDTSYLRENLNALHAACGEGMPAELWTYVEPVIRAGQRASAALPKSSKSLLEGSSEEVKLARRFLVHALEGRGDLALDLTLDAARRGLAPAHVAEHVVGRALTEIGRLWQVGEATVADEHLCSRVAERALGALAAIVPRAEANGLRVATLAIGGDLHDIGLRLVADAFEGAGWSVMHLGANMPGDHLMQMLRDPGVDLLAIAVTMGLHLRKTAQWIERVRSDAEFDRMAILVGGSIFAATPDLYRTIGADGTAGSATHAVTVGRRLVESRRPAK